MKLFLLTLLAAIVGVSITSAEDLPNSRETRSVKKERAITYATQGKESLLLDLAAPAEGGPYPLVVCFHGGAWREGDRRDLSSASLDADGKKVPSVIETIARSGYVVASVGYRLLPKHRFPAQIEDAKTVVRFFRENAKRFNIDPTRVGAVGFSAGAHLALLLGTTDTKAGLDGTLYPKQSSAVSCVVSFFGPTDLSLYAATPGLEDAYMVPFLGKAVKTDPTIYKLASPIDHISRTSAPTLLIHGTADIVVPIIHSERFLKKMHDAGARAELIKMKGEGHSWEGEAAVQSLQETLRFLDAELKEKK